MQEIRALAVVLVVAVVTVLASPAAGARGPDDGAERRISHKIIAIIEHYKQPDPVGIPEVPISDPLAIPPMKHTVSMATMQFRDMQVFGLSRFRLERVRSDVAAMEVNVALQIDELVTNGTYTLSNFFYRSTGPFAVKLTNVRVLGPARLEVTRTGQLQAQRLDMDVVFETIAMNFENLGFAASIIQSVINSLGTFLFNSIKPFILSEINNNIRGQINDQVANLSVTFPNSVSPFDMVVAEARKKVRDLGNDPYRLDNYNHSVGVFSLQMTNTWISGLSTFYRVGNITVEAANGTVYLKARVGTQRLRGSSNWELSLGSGILSRAGVLAFSVEYIQIGVAFNQSMDISKHPYIEDVQLEVGNIQVQCDGAGTLDYAVELMINLLPNLLRYQIMDMVEGPLRHTVQEQLNGVNFERTVLSKLPQLDEMEKNGFDSDDVLAMLNVT